MLSAFRAPGLAQKVYRFSRGKCTVKEGTGKLTDRGLLFADTRYYAGGPADIVLRLLRDSAAAWFPAAAAAFILRVPGR